MSPQKTAPSRKTLLDIYDRLFSRYGPQHWWPARSRFEVMVGAILTQNTAWTNVEKAIANLKRARLLSPGGLRKAGPKRLAALIKPAGYFNVKARRLKNFIDFLFAEYGGDPAAMAPRETALLRRELLSVNGVGPETADSILLYALGKKVFVVDAYTRRVLSRHRLIRPDATYDDIQRMFMRALPGNERLFNEFHALIVKVAKELCRKKPACAACPLKKTEGHYEIREKAKV